MLCRYTGYTIQFRALWGKYARLQELKSMTQVGWQPWAMYAADEETWAVPQGQCASISGVNTDTAWFGHWWFTKSLGHSFFRTCWVWVARPIDQEPIENQDSVVLPLRPPHSALDSTCFWLHAWLPRFGWCHRPIAYRAFRHITGYFELVTCTAFRKRTGVRQTTKLLYYINLEYGHCTGPLYSFFCLLSSPVLTAKFILVRREKSQPALWQIAAQAKRWQAGTPQCGAGQCSCVHVRRRLHVRHSAGRSGICSSSCKIGDACAKLAAARGGAHLF